MNGWGHTCLCFLWHAHCIYRYMRIEDGTVCGNETLTPYLKAARWLMSNSATRLDPKQPQTTCPIGTIIKVLSDQWIYPVTYREVNVFFTHGTSHVSRCASYHPAFASICSRALDVRNETFFVRKKKQPRRGSHTHDVAGFLCASYQASVTRLTSHVRWQLETSHLTLSYWPRAPFHLVVL